MNTLPFLHLHDFILKFQRRINNEGFSICSLTCAHCLILPVVELQLQSLNCPEAIRYRESLSFQ